MTKENVNTPYDDAFRTLIVKCPVLVIPLVNEVFHERYELWENVSVFHNEFFVGNRHQKERITDSHIGIGNKRYHAECQSSTDGTIFTFPHSALLYLRCSSNTPRTMRVTHKVPNGCISYEIPILKVPEYTADEILKKELYFLIPFHIFAYEKALESINNDYKKLEDLLQTYKRFAEVLQRKVKAGRLTEYERQVIRDMTVKVVSSLAAKWPNVRKGVENIMGGAILELEVDKILNRGIDIGKEVGRTEGIVSSMISLVRDGLLDLAEGAKRANMTPEEFEQKVKGV